MADNMQNAEEVAALVEDEGADVLLADGVTVVKCIVDEDYTSIRRQFPQDISERLSGRAALFYMTDESEKKIPRGTPITYDGQQWTHLQTRSHQSARTTTMRICLFSTGGLL